MASAPTEIRTPVLGLKGLRPSPLDDGGKQAGWIVPFPGIHVNNQFFFLSFFAMAAPVAGRVGSFFA